MDEPMAELSIFFFFYINVLNYERYVTFACRVEQWKMVRT